MGDRPVQAPTVIASPSRNRTSHVWLYFTLQEGGAGLCRLCGAFVSSNKKASSSNMWVHLQKRHEAEYAHLRGTNPAAPRDHRANHSTGNLVFDLANGPTQEELISVGHAMPHPSNGEQVVMKEEPEEEMAEEGAAASLPPPVSVPLHTPEDSEERALRAPFEYIRRMPGKQIRSQLALAFNQWMAVPEQQLRNIMEIVEMLHNASLLIDDIEDDSVLRRGLPVTHSIFGAPRTINSANYMYFVALERCVALGNPNAVAVFTEQLLELHRGQGKELFWRDTVLCPTLSQYEAMVLQKTGGLFFLAVRLMQLFSTNTCDFSGLLSYLAIFFQIRDDLLNLSSEEMAKQKTAAEDLTEGKFSYPIIVALQGRPLDDDQVLNILRQRTKNMDVKMYCVDLVKERGAFELTKARLRELMEQIESEVAALGGNSRMESVMVLLKKDIDKS